MKRLIKNWDELTLTHKLCVAVGLVCNLAAIVFGVLGMAQVLPDANRIFLPLMCVSMLCQGLRFWKNERTTAIISLFCGAVVLVCTVLVWFLD